MKELVEKGATVHTCSLDEAELDECLKEWKGKGLMITGSVCDVSSRIQRERLIETVTSIFDGKLNILVSCRITIHFLFSQTCPLHFIFFFHRIILQNLYTL